MHRSLEEVKEHWASSTIHQKQTMFYQACEQSRLDVVEYILSSEDLGTVNLPRNFPLHQAAERGYHQIVEALLKYGAPINAKDATGATALHLACVANHRIVVNILLKNGANHECRDFLHQTALHYACQQGNDEVVRALLNYGVNVQSTDRHGRNAVHFAVYGGNPLVLKTLLRFGANMKCLDQQWKSPLHLAADLPVLDVDIFKVLLDAGADIDGNGQPGTMKFKEDAKARQAFCLSVGYRCVENVLEPSIYQTPLQIACCSLRNLTVEYLLSQGANVNAEDDLGRTALHYATVFGNVHIIKILLQYGADPNLHEREYGRAPLHWAHKPEIASTLLKAGATVDGLTYTKDTPLMCAAHLGLREIVELLINHGADVNARNYRSTTAVHYAAEAQSTEVIDQLMESRANICSTDRNGLWPVHYAFQKVSDLTPLTVDFVIQILEYYVEYAISDIPILVKILADLENPTALFAAAKFIWKMQRINWAKHLVDDMSHLFDPYPGYLNYTRIDWKDASVEMDKMKNTKIDLTNFSYFDVFVKPKAIERSDHIRETLKLFTMTNLLNEFPHYGRLFFIRVQKAVKRNKLLCQSERSFSLMRPLLTVECIEYICDLLSDEDLEVLIEAC